MDGRPMHTGQQSQTVGGYNQMQARGQQRQGGRPPQGGKFHQKGGPRDKRPMLNNNNNKMMPNMPADVQNVNMQQNAIM